MEIRIIIIQNNQNIVKEFNSLIDAAQWLTSLSPKKEYDVGVVIEPSSKLEYPIIMTQTDTTLEQPKKNWLERIINKLS